MKGLGETYRNAEASGGDFEKLPPGGYVCTIKKVINNEPKSYLQIVFDIREGEYMDFFNNDWGKDNEWAHTCYHSYSEKAYGIFKGFLKAVDESNNTDFMEQAVGNWDEQRLVGKAIGYIIGEEEYESNKGEIRTSLKVRRTVPINVIREGKYKMPELKKLATKSDTTEPTIPSKPDKPNLDDIPF